MNESPKQQLIRLNRDVEALKREIAEMQEGMLLLADQLKKDKKKAA